MSKRSSSTSKASINPGSPHQTNDRCSLCDQHTYPRQIKFVGIEFNPKSLPAQESELNQCLSSNYTILERIQTEAGLVFVLGKFDCPSAGGVENTPASAESWKGAEVA